MLPYPGRNESYRSWDARCKEYERNQQAYRNSLRQGRFTPKQTERFERVKAKLPEGWSYRLQGEGEEYIWGVTLFDAEEREAGYVAKPDRKKLTQTAHYTGENGKLKKLLLNRVSAALWHSQPCWWTIGKNGEPVEV